MVKDYNDQSALLKAMAHPARLQILDMLRREELCVCHIERALDKRQAYISQQLMTLRDSGLISSRKDGLRVYYQLVDPRVTALLETFYGPVDEEGHELIAECPCPECSTVSLTAT